jgi:hypothetical protein
MGRATPSLSKIPMTGFDDILFLRYSLVSLQGSTHAGLTHQGENAPFFPPSS